ncbi:MAG: AbrB family transcriptional regulator [Lachnospiraceae bacterium]|nr:AbrB family transcriptional regulator [Lachnospiraceae bacterium]
MSVFIGFVLFWGVSYAGYEAGRRVKVPAPAILGPILAFMVLAFFGIKLQVPSWQKPALSVLTGILLGIRMKHSMKGIYKQVLVYAVWLILLTIAGVWLLTAIGIDKETAFFAATPGGMAEISLMSLNYHSDPFVTVLLQSSRMLISMAVFSAIGSRYRLSTAEEGKETDRKPEKPENPRISLLLWCVLIVISLAAAALLGKLHVPVPNILGPMLVIGAAVKGGKYECKIPRRVQTFVQMGIGGLTGSSISRESMMGLPHYILPVILLSTLVILSGLLMAFLLMRFTDWDKATCIMSCCPAGLSPSIMVAMEYGANANIVTVFQVLRMVTVLIATPLMVEWML